MRWNLAKLDTLWVTFHNDAPVQGTNVPANRSVIIKSLKNICYGKVHTDPTDLCGPQINEKDLLAIRDSVSQLNTFLPCLLKHSHNFKVGRIAAPFAAWKDNIMIM